VAIINKEKDINMYTPAILLTKSHCLIECIMQFSTTQTNICLYLLYLLYMVFINAFYVVVVVSLKGFFKNDSNDFFLVLSFSHEWIINFYYLNS
jgi:hypothetical protein